MNQSFRDLELIAIDDGSIDSTGAVLRAFSDPRVRVLDGGGRGVAHAANLGLAAARAPLIARMDADDECHPRKLELSLAALSADLSGVGTQVEIFGFMTSDVSSERVWTWRASA